MVAGAMWLLQLAWIAPVQSQFPGMHLNFWMATMIMCLLAAGGNVINDYFDISEDLINKPRKALVGRVITRRQAMKLHYGLSASALLISVFLSWHLMSPIPLIWTSCLGTLLWGYSPWFKRRFIRGNLAIALVIAQLPFWTLLSSQPLVEWSSYFAEPAGVGLLTYAALSAFITFLREVTKDLQDRAGDFEAGYDTLPVRWGADRSLKFLEVGHFIGWALLLGTAYLAWKVIGRGIESAFFLLPFAGAHIQLRRGLIQSVSAWQKLTLAGGLLFLAMMIWN